MTNAGLVSDNIRQHEWIFANIGAIWHTCIPCWRDVKPVKTNESLLTSTTESTEQLALVNNYVI